MGGWKDYMDWKPSDIEALLRVVRAADKFAGDKWDFASSLAPPETWTQLLEALEALPEHLRTVDKR